MHIESNRERETDTAGRELIMQTGGGGRLERKGGGKKKKRTS